MGAQLFWQAQYLHMLDDALDLRLPKLQVGEHWSSDRLYKAPERKGGPIGDLFNSGG
jgi:hypothetical protein